MDFNELYHFLFESYAGLGVLVGCCLLLTLLISVLLEKKTRKRYKNHAKTEDDWSFFEASGK